MEQMERLNMHILIDFFMMRDIYLSFQFLSGCAGIHSLYHRRVTRRLIQDPDPVNMNGGGKRVKAALQGIPV